MANWRSAIVRGIARFLGAREYTATKTGNHVWGGSRVYSSASADSDLIAARPVLRERSRHAYQNHASARAIVESLVGLVVSTGIDVEPDTGEESVDDSLRDAFVEWCEYADAGGRLDFYELTRQAFRSVVMAGECLAVIHDLDGDRPVPFAISVLEPDQLASDPVAPVAPGCTFVDGIEMDAYRRPVAYHVLSAPADSTTQPLGGSLVPGSGGVQTVGSGSWRASGHRITADRVIHVYEVTRPGQTRGEPWLAPILGTMHQERQLVEAELTAAKICAAHAVAITSEGAGWPAGDDAASGTGDAGEPTYDFTPGAVSRLGPGEKAEVIKNDRPSQQIAPFRKMLRGDLAGASRLPQRLIDRDVSGANYSSMRADMLDTRRQLDPVQQWFGRGFAAEVYRRLLPQLAVYAGIRIPPAGTRERRAFMRCKVMPDGWAYVDPEKDVAAGIAAIRAGFSTWEEEVQGRGRDPRKVLAQLKKEIGDDVLGSIFSETSPGNGSANANDAESSQDEEYEPEMDDDDSDVAAQQKQ